MRRLLDPSVKLRVSFSRGICLPQAENLPSHFGEMTTRIRRVHDIALLTWAIHRLEKFDRPMRWDKVYFRDDLKAKLCVFYKDARSFFLRQDKVFFLNLKSDTVQLKRTGKIQNLDAVQLSDVLHSSLPPLGCLPLELLALLAHRSHPNKVLDVFEKSSTLQKHFTIVTNKYHQQFFYRKSEIQFATGHFFCANNSVAIALEAAARLLPTVPSYWVPISMCIQRVPLQHQSFIQNHGYRKIEGVLCGQLESAYYRRALFIRRTENCPPWKDILKCTNRYDGYDISPMRALKIAFCIPDQPTSLQKCWKGLFPSIRTWFAQFPAYSLTEIAHMFPKAIHLDANGYLRSVVRQQATSMKIGKPLDDVDEGDFDTAINDPANEALKNTLISLVSEPSKTFFTRNDSFQHLEHRREVADGRFYTKDEIYALILQCIQPEERISWTVILERLDELPNVDKQKLNDTINGLFIRATARFLRFILENQPCPVKVHEKSTPGKSGYEVFFGRGDLHAPAEGNEYLDPTKLLSEVCQQVKNAHMKLRGREHTFVGLSLVASRLPLQVHIALKAFGGLAQFIKANDHILSLDRKGVISFRDESRSREES
ncbi:hypothetical protein XU18_4986 [Perkinsela sp. CCAP 1560/4]|nr:hypothetical protein XU18_4986 [Perkinsela sp. CCAP 1560/4]|eukprot:KNH03646.1 hypothetical protein XU18_4986 [Perkinsela sp. CCAP 1560/4]